MGEWPVAGRPYRRRLAAWTREGLEQVEPLLWPTLQTAVAAGIVSTEILRATGLDAAGAQARLSGTST
jgi:hypothetical protein